jgi:hypothetical protein
MSSRIRDCHGGVRGSHETTSQAPQLWTSECAGGNGAAIVASQSKLELSGVLEREVRANLVFWNFTRVGAGKTPDAKTIGRRGVAIGVGCGQANSHADRDHSLRHRAGDGALKTTVDQALIRGLDTARASS